MADELRREADEFVDLVNLAAEIARPPSQTEGDIPTPARPDAVCAERE